MPPNNTGLPFAGTEMHGNAESNLVQKTEESNQELLAVVANDLLRFSDPESFLQSIFLQISAQTSVDLCLSYVFKESHLELTFAGGLTPDLRQSINRLDLGEGVCGLAGRLRSFIQRDAISATEEPGTAFLRSIGIETFCCYPLLINEKLLGTLSFGSKRSTYFSESELELQRAIADQVTAAFHRISLSQELARNTEMLLAANTELRRARAALDQIAFSTSHDLREPIRHLSLYTELLRRDLKADPDAATGQYLNFLSSSARRIGSLVDDLQVYTTVNRTPAEPEFVDSTAVARAVVSKLHPLIEETWARINIEPLPPVRMAQDDLAALLEHLIENAIVHHHSGTIPDIHIYSFLSKSGLVICVRDNGAGIEPRYQDQIFGLFKRLNPTERENSTGLGLALCRKIIERYQGQIWVESEPGKGALFCFALPQQAAPRVRSTAVGSG